MCLSYIYNFFINVFYFINEFSYSNKNKNKDKESISSKNNNIFNYNPYNNIYDDIDGWVSIKTCI